MKALEERCEEKGFSKCGTKAELIKRLEVQNPEGLQVVTPPPVWYTPTPPRGTNIVRFVSPIQETPLQLPIATFVQETPQNLNISRDMFSDSMQDLSSCVPETPIPASRKSKFNLDFLDFSKFIGH